jgi:hypothetical protein
LKCSLAFDNSPSMRSVDENGFMRVASSHITKETVNPYYGREIPGWEELSLDPNHIYYGYRAGDELKKAAPTFEGLPLLLGHHIESADAPQKEYRVGSTGTDATWNAPYLDNSLFITDSNAIRMVEDGHMKELSCAYYYEPDFTPGKFEGVPYDFVMRHIRGNHIALVEEGRAGADVVVADAQIKTDNSLRKTMSRLFDRFKGAFDKAPEEDIRKDEAVAQDENQLTKVLMLINAFVEKMPPEEVEELAHKLNDIVTPKEEQAEVKEEVKVEEPVTGETVTTDIKAEEKIETTGGVEIKTEETATGEDKAVKRSAPDHEIEGEIVPGSSESDGTAEDVNPDVIAKDVKESAKEVVEAAKETVETVKEAIQTPAVTKKATWWNRFWSAILGAILAVAAMFGVNTEQIKEQKAKTEEVKTLAGEALAAFKAGDTKTGMEKLNAVQTVGKEVVKNTKEMVETVKDADKKTVVKNIKTALISANTKAVEATAKQYTEPTVKPVVKK